MTVLKVPAYHFRIAALASLKVGPRGRKADRWPAMPVKIKRTNRWESGRLHIAVDHAERTDAGLVVSGKITTATLLKEAGEPVAGNFDSVVIPWNNNLEASFEADLDT